MQTAFSASTEETLVHLLLQIAVILTAAKGLGAVFVRIGQSRSIGEILAGVMLGPSLFGWLARRFPWLDRRFNRRRRIRSQSAWFGESCDQLELQWTGDSGGPYRLEIRTRCVYPGAPLIGVHVTQLWPVAAPSLQPAEPAARPDRPFRVPRAPDGLPPAA